MQQEFSKKFHVNGTPMPDSSFNVIIAGHGKDLRAVKAGLRAGGGTGGKSFRQKRDIRREVMV